MRAGGLGLLLLLSGSPAVAGDLRALCTDRPGLGTPACTVDAGHLQAEVGLADWTRDTQPDSRSDTLLLGDVALRYGIGATTELRFGWTAIGRERERDRLNGSVAKATAIGDVTFGLKQNLRSPDGSALSIAVLPEATLPVGRAPIGQTSWSASLLVPVDYELRDGIDLQFTPEIDAAANQEDKGRHLAYAAVLGLDIDLTDALAFDVEVQAMRDRDPEGHQRLAFAAAAIDYKPQEQVQLDLGAIAGLNHASPDMEVYFGVATKF